MGYSRSAAVCCCSFYFLCAAEENMSGAADAEHFPQTHLAEMRTVIYIEAHKTRILKISSSQILIIVAPVNIATNRKYH